MVKFIGGRKIRSIVSVFALITVVFYFTYHLVSGEKGVLAMIKLEQRLEVAQAEYDAVKLDRIKKQHRVSMLYNDSLDMDLLDTQARKILGVAQEKEFVLIQNEDGS